MPPFIAENPSTAIAVWSIFVFLIGFLFGKARGRKGAPHDRASMRPPQMPLDPPDLPHDIQARIDEALSKKKRIEAIRILREHSGLGLADAKAHIDTIARRQGHR